MRWTANRFASGLLTKHAGDKHRKPAFQGSLTTGIIESTRGVTAFFFVVVRWTLAAATFASVSYPYCLYAQVIPPQPIPFPPLPPPLPDLPPPAPMEPILPPIPPIPPKREPSLPLRVFVHDIQLVGHTIFTF
jgi:hypothetical protein